MTAAPGNALGSFGTLRHRRMEPGDIQECVDLIANDPVIGPRYGKLIDQLPAIWLECLGSESSLSQVFIAGEGRRARICLCGVTAVVSDSFIREMKTPPHFWIGPEMTRRAVAGAAPFLTGKEFREANACGGLNLVCWENCVAAGFEANSELHRCMMSVFVQTHRGYLWKEVIANQPESADRLGFLLSTGALLWDGEASRYTTELNRTPGRIVSSPHVLGITRDLERNRERNWGGRWVDALFDYQTPALGLSPGEQRLLLCALDGSTDEHLAATLGVSLPAVKKIWVSVYRRVEERLPELLHDPSRPEFPVRSRGREKRRHLLLWLRDHSEELRPYSRRHLAKAAGA